jgi:hypothetical protein
MVKGEKIMPTPGGEITSSEIWKAPVETVEEVVEDSTTEEEVEDDLPELS